MLHNWLYSLLSLLNSILLHEKIFISLFGLKDFSYSSLERGSEGEKHQGMVASQAPPSEDTAHNPAMCLD